MTARRFSVRRLVLNLLLTSADIWSHWPAGKGCGLTETFLTTLDAARTGAQWAWTEIYRNLAPSVLGYLRARGANEPEEVLGCVFLDVVQALPRFEGGHAEFRTWVFTIAHRRLVDDLRGRRRRPSEAASPETLEQAPLSGNVEDDALRALATEEVRRHLERLSAAQREVLVLRILTGFTIAETARVLGKRPGAVKSLQVRALEALRREISAEAVTSVPPETITETE